MGLEHARDRRAVAELAIAATGPYWARIDPDAVAASWQQQLPAVTSVVSGAQLVAATQADPYVGATTIAPVAQYAVVASALAGTAADGRSLDSLLYWPIVQALIAARSGKEIDNALAAAKRVYETVIRTEIADAGRTADQIAITTHDIPGYVRVVVGPTCARCIVLSGRWYPYSAGFQRHPNCLPAGVVVAGPKCVAATRRFYQGELAIITTAGGHELPVTGNHPILTNRGWVPAHLVQEGDHVVRSTLREGARPLTVPHEHHVPTRIENLWRARGVASFVQVPTSAEDFHGDGRNGNVDVVLANGLLGDWTKTPIDEHLLHECITSGMALSASFATQGPGHQGLVGGPPAPIGSDLHGVLGRAVAPPRGFFTGAVDPTDRLMGGLGLSGPLRWGHLGGSNFASLGASPQINSGGQEGSPYRAAANAVVDRQRVFAFASEIRPGDLVDIKHTKSPRWDPPGGPFTVQNRVGYASRGQDLLIRLSGQVALDRVVENRRVSWSGHVYNLTTTEGWYSANGLIVSNCDCVHLPATDTQAAKFGIGPRAVYEAMTPEQRSYAGWSKADQEAINAGADISRVTNIRRGGLYVAGGKQYTYELAGKRKRMTPRQIFIEAAGDRDKAIQLLLRFGYIIPR